MPLLILAVGALAVLLQGAFFRGSDGNPLACAAAAAGGVAALLPGSGEPPILGLAATPFSRYFTILFCLCALLTLLLSRGHNRRSGIGGEEFAATVLFAALGMSVTCMAQNLLILFLGLESLTFAFYILTAADRGSEASGEAGLKYLILGAAAAAFNAFGIALLYAGSGTLALPSALQVGVHGEGRTILLAGLGFLLAGLAFKVSLVPFHLWTPDVYEGAPPPVTGFLSTASKGAVFASLLILFSGWDIETLKPPLRCLALASMVLGNLAPLLQGNLRRMLAYSSVAQMGYITLALLTGTPEGYEAVAFYAAAYAAMNIAAFGVISSLSGGRPLQSVRQLRGVGYRHPLRGGLLALSMLALAGIPPTIGFTGKFAIFLAALKGGETGLAVAGLLTAAVSVYYYLRVVVNLYMHPAEGTSDAPACGIGEAAALAAAAAAIVVPGIFPSPMFELLRRVISG
ncbi:MAG TPA: NADH-quinone oxidoreductase subunit N [Verrucomicrobiae bacterium]|nr:NADH-quinone oxidoreductase subunit N [Verrucomicrobiae bacterium]